MIPPPNQSRQPVRRDGDDLVLEIRVQPRASRDTFAGTLGNALKLCITAPPVDGKANRHLIRVLARMFDVPRSRVVLESGAKGRCKRLRIVRPGTVPADVRACFEA